MRILFVLNRFPVLSQTFVLDQITGMIDRGHHVEVFALEGAKRARTHDDIQRYELLERTMYRTRTPSSPWARLTGAATMGADLVRRAPQKLPRILASLDYARPTHSLSVFHAAVRDLQDRNYDIVHCHFGPMAIRGVQFRELGLIRSPIVATFHGYDVHRYPRLHGDDVYRSIVDEVDLITANTEFTAGCVAKLGFPTRRIRVLPVGLAVDSFDYRPRRPEAGEPIRILSVARLVEKKGLEFAIRAVSRLKDTFNFRYTIVGEGPLREPLGALIRSLGLENSVVLVGEKTRDEVRTFYQKNHLFVLPSVTAADGDMEGQGLVLQEAQACGLPVVSTRHNGIPEGVLDEESGLLVPERDIEALTAALRRLFEQPESWSDMGRAGRDFVESKYQIDVLNDRLVEIYRELVT